MFSKFQKVNIFGSRDNKEEAASATNKLKLFSEVTTKYKSLVGKYKKEIGQPLNIYSDMISALPYGELAIAFDGPVILKTVGDNKRIVIDEGVAFTRFDWRSSQYFYPDYEMVKHLASTDTEIVCVYSQDFSKVDFHFITQKSYMSRVNTYVPFKELYKVVDSNDEIPGVSHKEIPLSLFASYDVTTIAKVDGKELLLEVKRKGCPNNILLIDIYNLTDGVKGSNSLGIAEYPYDLENGAYVTLAELEECVKVKLGN